MPTESVQYKNPDRRPFLWAVVVALFLLPVVGVLGLVVMSGRRPIQAGPPPIRLTPPPKAVADALTPLEGASGVSRQGGALESFHVYYTLKQNYPATNVVEKISSRLKALGWRPLKEDWLNPGRLSSHVAGWGSYHDVTPGQVPTQEISWHGQWENDAGDLVDFTFGYSDPIGTAKPQTLIVNESWYPAAGRAIMQRPRRPGWLPDWLPNWLRL